jgi:hypothetical protein
MANTDATLGKLISWVSTGVGDTLSCNILPPKGTKGVQIESINIDLEDLTVTITGRGGASKVVVFADPTGRLGTVGDESFDIARVVISNVPVGTNTFRISAN